MGGVASAGPYASVFPVLRALDHEPDPLIDTAGINRVLERGKFVTLTRDYSVSTATSRKNSTETGSHPQFPSSTESQKNTIRSRSGNLTAQAAMDSGDNKPPPQYEEYEQFPSSPWAQSPAPSPAIQTDPSDNPFFAEETNVEDYTFNPTESPQDYSRFGPVEAIGIDKAHTVTHIPLIHPILSQVMQPLDSITPSQTPAMSRRTTGNMSQHPQQVRKAPIAILSILSSTVPFPQNLTNSLKLLAPHLATSFSNAWQYTNAHQQATRIRHRRYLSNHQVGLAPIHGPESLDNLMHFDIEDVADSQGGSVTSPSDCSGRSRQSPGGSMGGTPGWDQSGAGFASKYSIGGTPGHVTGTEMVDSYFDSKKRSTYTTPARTPGGQPQHEQSTRKHSASVDPPSGAKKATGNTPPDTGEDDTPTPRSEHKPKPVNVSSDVQDQSTPQSQPLSPRRLRNLSHQPSNTSDRKPHSFLHSYGADFSSSFQSLPSATVPGAAQTLRPSHHGRSGSIPDVVEMPSMPPPSERLLRTIIDSLPVQIFTAQPSTGHMTWFNSKYLVYRGGDSQQALTDPWQSIHPEERDAYLDQWNKSLRTGQQLQQKVRLLRFDGQYRWFYVRVAPLKDKKQQIVHWIGTNMDFHEQHLAEANSARQQETAASEAKYRALANSSPQIVFVVTNKRGITFCNSQWQSYSGQEEAQTLGIGFLEQVHPEDIVKCRLPVMNEDDSAPANVPVSVLVEHSRQYSSESDNAPGSVTSPGNTSPATMNMPQARLSKLATEGILKITKDADGRPSYSTEVRLRSKDGNYRWHLVRILLENTVASEPREEETWYGTCTDINDHKLLEQTLKETMDAKTRFLSNMSHEIRTPLNGITGMVNFLLDSPLGPEQMEHVNIIRNSTEGLRDLINDILDLSKVEAGMITLHPDWLHLPSLIEEVNDLTSALAIGKGLELNYVVEEEVPSMAKGDKFRLRQVLLNVIGNAIKFTQTGEVFVRCQLVADKAKNEDVNEAVVQFEVIDTGSGFTKKEAEFLFKRFSQIDASSTRQHGGTGLGLAISMQLVELHGGKMKASSVPGEGSNFTFTIKFGLPSDTDHPPSQIATPSSGLIESPDKPPLPSQIFQGETMSRIQRLAAESPGHVGFTESPSRKSPTSSLPSSERSHESPSLSSGSSDPSIYTGQRSIPSIRSERSSASSFLPESSLLKKTTIELALPNQTKSAHTDSDASRKGSTESGRSSSIHRSLSPLGSTLQPPMYSILVICPLKYSREATVKHIKRTLPKAVPHQITSKADLNEARELIGGDDPVLFTHVVLVLALSSDVTSFMNLVFNSTAHSSTSMVIISDTMQKREIMKNAPKYDYEKLIWDRRLRFIYKPLKPSKFAVIFDPQRERDMSTDRNQDTAQQVATSQKLVFEDLKKRLGNKGFRVLLVEDNFINQTVCILQPFKQSQKSC
jgi:PAS domain S-box-containing protein